MLNGKIMAVLMLSMATPVLAESLTPSDTPTTEQSAEQSTEQKAAEAVVRQYMDFLHSGDLEGIMGLYGENAVFLPEGGPTATGKDNIRETYTALFQNVSIPEGESVLEEATIHGDIAVVRLASTATMKILADQQIVPLNTREIFILTKVGDAYKISSYMFNNSK